jgi:hypothetical protein
LHKKKAEGVLANGVEGARGEILRSPVFLLDDVRISFFIII